MNFNNYWVSFLLLILLILFLLGLFRNIYFLKKIIIDAANTKSFGKFMMSIFFIILTYFIILRRIGRIKYHYPKFNIFN